MNPAILLADEPTGNLDNKNSLKVILLMKKLMAELKQTMLMVTHDESIAEMADRIIRIEDGKSIR